MRALAAAALLTLTGLPVSAQQAIQRSFTLHGQVLDYHSDMPVALAEVEIPELKRRVLADSAGRFRFTDLPEGTYTFVVARIGYAASSEASTVRDGNYLQVRLLPNPIVLEGLTALGDRFEGRMNSVGFAGYARSRDALARSTASSVAQFLSDHFQVSLAPCTPSSNEKNCLRLRGRARSVTVYLDDVLLPGGVTMLASYRPNDLYRVEVYPALGLIHLYTPHFVEWAAEHGIRPKPICLVCGR